MKGNDTGDMMNPEILQQLVQVKMPFGKYKGVLLHRLPISYLEWFQRKSFPTGKLGVMLLTVYEIKLNGLEYLLDPLLKNNYKTFPKGKTPANES